MESKHPVEDILIKPIKRIWTEHYGNSLIATSALILATVYYIALRSDIMNGDCIHEGYLRYFNDIWHVMLGRWEVPLLARAHLHIVMPSLFILIYTLIIIITTILITELWGIKGRA